MVFTRAAFTFSLLACFAFLPAAWARDITLVTGETLRDVEIIQIEPDGVRLTHSGGSGKIGFNRLPDELRAEFRYDPDKAAEFEQLKAQVQQEVRARELERLREKTVLVLGRVVRKTADGLVVRCDWADLWKPLELTDEARKRWESQKDQIPPDALVSPGSDRAWIARRWVTAGRDLPLFFTTSSLLRHRDPIVFASLPPRVRGEIFLTQYPGEDKLDLESPLSAFVYPDGTHSEDSLLGRSELPSYRVAEPDLELSQAATQFNAR